MMRYLLLPLLLMSFSFPGIPFHGSVKKTVMLVHKSTGSPRIENEEYIPWQNERRLQWADFHCPPVQGTDAVASTSTSLGMSYQIKENEWSYEINCRFSKNKSWGLVKTGYILSHEQGHFDITEIYARLLNKALQQYRFNRRSFKTDLSSIYDTIVKQKEEMQAQYDEETDHSRNKAVQMEWLQRINAMLNDTEAYANY